jgi:hypothetical protein
MPPNYPLFFDEHIRTAEEIRRLKQELSFRGMVNATTARVDAIVAPISTRLFPRRQAEQPNPARNRAELVARLNGYSNVHLLNLFNGAFPDLPQKFWETMANGLVGESHPDEFNAPHSARKTFINRLADHLQTSPDSPNSGWQKHLKRNELDRLKNVDEARLQAIDEARLLTDDPLPLYEQVDQLLVEQPQGTDAGPHAGAGARVADNPLEGSVEPPRSQSVAADSRLPLGPVSPVSGGPIGELHDPGLSAPGALPSGFDTTRLAAAAVSPGRTLASPGAGRVGGQGTAAPSSAPAAAAGQAAQQARQAPSR